MSELEVNATTCDGEKIFSKMILRRLERVSPFLPFVIGSLDNYSIVINADFFYAQGPIYVLCFDYSPRVLSYVCFCCMLCAWYHPYAHLFVHYVVHYMFAFDRSQRAQCESLLSEESSTAPGTAFDPR
jgi:hypothetical protein